MDEMGSEFGNSPGMTQGTGRVQDGRGKYPDGWWLWRWEYWGKTISMAGGAIHQYAFPFPLINVLSYNYGSFR